MTSRTPLQRFLRRAVLVGALVAVPGCAGEAPPVEETPQAPVDTAVEAVSDTVADSVMARDTAQ